MKNTLIFIFAFAFFVTNYSYGSNLELSGLFQTIHLHPADSSSGNLGTPVSIVRIDEEHMAVASYTAIWLVSEKTGEIRQLAKPEGVPLWYPTGLAYDPITNELFIANYLGKDVLILERKNGEFELKSRVQDPDLIGAENISLSGDGKYFAVADFDNNGVLLFERGSNRKLWYRYFGRAHGISFNSDNTAVIATGLAPPQVAQFDLHGQQTALKGNEGWGKNGYLWPTAVALNPATSQVWISDAHMGKIRALDYGLDEDIGFGMNGLGVGMFNMPYGIYYEPDGRLWITDTFKSRLLLLDEGRHILKTYLSAPESLPHMLHCRTGICAQREIEFSETAQQPIGVGYQGRINQNRSIVHDFGVHGERQWHNGYNYSAFINPDVGQLALAGAAPLFSSSIYYWVQSISYGGYLIYGSPQVREWIVDINGLACPVSLGMNYWVESGELRSDQLPDHKPQDIIDLCLKRYSKFQENIEAGKDPFFSYAENFLGKSGELASTQFATAFQSEKGRQFHAQLCRAENHDSRKELALNFIDSISEDTLIHLPEIWIARLFSEPYGGNSEKLNCDGR